MTCPVCESLDTDIRCELDKTNQDSFFEFSKVKFSGYLDEIVKKGLHPLIYGCNDCKFCWYNEIPTNDQLMKMYSKAIVKPTSEYFKFKDKLNSQLLKGILRITKKNKIFLLKIS